MPFDIKDHLSEKERVVFHKDFLYVTEESVTFEDLKKTISWTRAYFKPAVHIFAHGGGGKFWLMREDRYGEKKQRWLIPSGSIEEGEEAEEAAMRELQEELGFRSDSLELVHFMPYSGKAYNDMRYYFLARDLVEESIENPDGDRILEKKLFSLDELKEMVLAGEFDWSPMAFAILKLYRDVESGEIKA